MPQQEIIDYLLSLTCLTSRIGFLGISDWKSLKPTNTRRCMAIVEEHYVLDVAPQLNLLRFNVEVRSQDVNVSVYVPHRLCALFSSLQNLKNENLLLHRNKNHTLKQMFLIYISGNIFADCS